MCQKLPNMTTIVFKRFYKEVRKKLIRSFDIRTVCDESGNGNRESFLGFVEVFKEKTVITVKHSWRPILFMTSFIMSR